MHVVVAPDKFKGSLTAREVADRVAAGIAAVEPGLAVVRVPVADGGDGTVDAALAAGYERVPVRATGPTGEPVDTAYAVRDGVAVVEMADVSGLRLLPPDRLAPLTATSYGTGEVVRAALDRGCRSVVLGHRRQREHRRRRRHAGGARRPAARRRRATALPRGGGALADLRPRRPGRPAPGRGGRPGSSSPATSTTRCSARTAPRRCTGRRRARAPTTSRRSTPRWRTGPTWSTRPRAARASATVRAPGPPAASATRPWPCSAPSSNRGSG